MQSFRFCAVVALIGSLMLFTGCAAPGGVGPQGHSTTTVLKAKNFTVKDRVSVSVDCAFIFGASINVGQFGLNMPGIPLGDYELWMRARTLLSEKANGNDVVNVTQDYRVLSYFGFYTIHTLTLTADTVEFN